MRFSHVSLLSLATVCLLGGPALHAQFGATSTLDDAFQNAFAALGSPGASVSVVQNGQVIWQNAAGMSDPAHAYTPATIQPMGSVGKTYTATLTMRLVEQGKIQLDAPINSYLANPVVDGDRVTVRHLLSQRSGYVEAFTGSEEETAKFADPTYPWTRAEVLGTVQRDGTFPIGERFEYSNTNYLLLGEIIDQMSGSSYGQYLANEILDPLGLTGTFVDENATRLDNFADGHFSFETGDVWDIECGPDAIRTGLMGEWLSDGGVAATAGDAARFFDALTNGEVLSEASMAEMFSFYPDSGYGFAVTDINFDLPGLWAGHNGAWMGYSAVVGYNPDLDLTLAVLVNNLTLLSPDNAELRRMDAQELFNYLTQVLQDTPTVPEPSYGAALAGIGALGIIALRRRQA